MHLGIPALLDFYRAHKNENSMVLVTIIGTEGSTYRKPGAMMLISSEGQFEGMISGGCLEGDLLHHADAVFLDGQPRFVTYDMHADDDLVWNLGLGCDGVIHLLLQRLDRENHFDFLDRLEALAKGRVAAILAVAIEPDADMPAGTSALVDENGEGSGERALQAAVKDVIGQGWPDWRFLKVSESPADRHGEIALINIPPRTRVLICGAGPDAVPVARTLAGLDWEVVVADHRPAFARPDRFPDHCRVIQARPEKIGEVLNLDELDAAVIMSHHLENDSLYLAQLANHEIGYLGCLGPRARSSRLKEMAGCPDAMVHGPVGLDIGAELPEAIALSLAAEIHAILNKRSGLPLTSR